MTNGTTEFASCILKNKISCILQEEEGENQSKALIWGSMLENYVAVPCHHEWVFQPTSFGRNNLINHREVAGIHVFNAEKEQAHLPGPMRPHEKFVSKEVTQQLGMQLRTTKDFSMQSGTRNWPETDKNSLQVSAIKKGTHEWNWCQCLFWNFLCPVV